MNSNIVVAEDLVKKYGDNLAVNQVNFTIQEGEVFGLLGPNGAGKSTAIKMLTCLFPPTSGRATINGHEVTKDPKKVKRIIGIVPQDLALYPTLSGRDNLIFFGELFGLGGKELRQRVSDVIEYVAMGERADDPVQTYSGGMKRRINLAVGLINKPRVLFLDEPTVGVDPQSRNHIFESVERLNREQDMSILYTTHYMEEAERLCHRIGIIDRGEIIAMDTPKNLIALLGGGIIHLGLVREEATWLERVRGLEHVQKADYLAPENGQDGDGKAVMKLEVKNASEALIEIIRLFNTLDVDIVSMETLEPNLESVFLHLTGKSLRR